MEGTLLRMRVEIREQIAAAWSPRVLRVGVCSSGAAELTSPQGVSLLVLAVLSSRFHTPLEPNVTHVLVHNVRPFTHRIITQRVEVDTQKVKIDTQRIEVDTEWAETDTQWVEIDTQ